MKAVRIIQSFFGVLLCVLGTALFAVEFINFFIAPLHVLFESPVLGWFAYCFRLLGAVSTIASGILAVMGKRNPMSMGVALCATLVSASLFSVMEWYFALPSVAVSLIVLFFSLDLIRPKAR